MADFYTPTELSDKLSIKVRTIQVQAIRGEIPGARKFGNQWRFCASTVDAWLAPTRGPLVSYEAKLAALDRFK